MDIDLKTLKMPVGFKITGEEERDSFEVSKAGDINGDGYADIIIGAPYASRYSGKSYIIFGSSMEFTDINLSMLKMPIGFKIFGENPGDFSGHFVSGAGDVNGDGYADIIIGAPDLRNNLGGKGYVILGKANGFTDIYLSTLKMPTGFKILGENKNDECGFSVKNAGDINKDGYGDIIIGAPNALNETGKSYVLLGRETSKLNDINLNTLKMPVGFSVSGENQKDHSGYSVSGAGDINKDGYDDIIIGAPEAGDGGTSYVIFGKASEFANIELRKLTSAQGFRIISEKGFEFCGESVSGAGDVNKDGYADVIIGAPNAGGNPTTEPGKSYVIFGNGIGFSDISLNKLSMPIGFKILGEKQPDNSGASVSDAGDINGDGYADVIIGAPQTGAGGKSYAIFGKSNGFSDIKLRVLNMPVGFRVLGEGASGWSVSGAGDINKDGYDDLIIGSIEKCYIIFGAPTSDSNHNSGNTILDNFIKIGIPVITCFMGIVAVGCMAYNRYRSKLEHSLINEGVNDAGYNAARAAGYAVLAGAATVPGADAKSVDEENGNEIFDANYDGVHVLGTVEEGSYYLDF